MICLECNKDVPTDRTICPYCASYIIPTVRPLQGYPIESRNQMGLPMLTFKANGVCFNMVKVEGGAFNHQGLKMVNTENNRPSEKACQSRLSPHNIQTFYIGETVVTQSLWEAVMLYGLKEVIDIDKVCSYQPGMIKGSNMPLYFTIVNFFDYGAIKWFVKKLSHLTGWIFDLPSEWQWEYAECGGQFSKGYKYAGSNNIDEVAWYLGNAQTHHLTPQPVKMKCANELGLYDMAGNVLEMCKPWSMIHVKGSYHSSDLEDCQIGTISKPIGQMGIRLVLNKQDKK